MISLEAKVCDWPLLTHRPHQITAEFLPPFPPVARLDSTRCAAALPMTTLIPREPYAKDELARLYPKELKLQLVQVVCVLIQPDSPANLHSSFAMVRQIGRLRVGLD